MKEYYTYILANKINGTLYIGVTSDLIKRIWEHKNKVTKGFTSRYDITQLMYFEQYDDVTSAIQREKRLKEWPRKWKLELINRHNTKWIDLYPSLI